MPKFVAFIIFLASLSGCTAIQDCHYETTNCLRTEWAWLTLGPNPRSPDPASPPVWGIASHYRYGWKQGYYDVAMGGAGQRPFLPPKKYWSASYQSPQGERAIEFWYQGYQQGAEAARHSGAGQYHYVRPYGLMTTPCAGPIPCAGPTPCAVPAPCVNPLPGAGPTSSVPTFEGVAPPTEAEQLPEFPEDIEPPTQPISTEVSREPPSWELMPPSPKSEVAAPAGPLFMFEGP